MDYTRKKHVITCLDTGKQTVHPSINAAKRESRQLQLNGNKVSVIRGS